MNSRIYSGRVMHARHHPIQHRFEYPILFYAIDLDELPTLAQNVKGFSSGPGSPVSLQSKTTYRETTDSAINLHPILPTPALNESSLSLLPVFSYPPLIRLTSIMD